VKVVDMNGSAVKDKKESLEQLLLARNKKLGDELTLLRVSHQDLQRRLESMQEDLSRTNAELEKSQNLSATLENDLLRVQEEAANALPSSAMSVAGTYSSRYPQGGRRGRSSPTSSIISGFDPSTRTPPSTMESLRAGEAYGGGSGILPMVQAQRDRFKQKNSQLEEELAKTYSTVSTLRQEVTSLQKDNLNLYEKTRYVSTYNRGPTSSSSAYANNPNPSTIQVSSEDRYRSVYEANISPFAAFRGRETARAYKKMSLPERIIFSITRMVLANRTSRNLFAGYCLALHILVFVMLYWMGTVDIEKHASNLGEAVSTVAGAGAAGLGGGGAGEAATHHGDWQQEAFNQGR
jgi:homeobox protein cut-like